MNSEAGTSRRGITRVGRQTSPRPIGHDQQADEVTGYEPMALRELETLTNIGQPGRLAVGSSRPQRPLGSSAVPLSGWLAARMPSSKAVERVVPEPQVATARELT